MVAASDVSFGGAPSAYPPPSDGSRGPGGPGPDPDTAAWWDAEAARAAAEPVAEQPEKRSRWGRNRKKDQPEPVGEDDWAAEPTGRWDERERAGTASERPMWPAEPTTGYGSDPAADRRPTRAESHGARPGDKNPAVPVQRKDVAAFDEDVAPLELNLDEEPRESGRSRRFLRRK